MAVIVPAVVPVLVLVLEVRRVLVPVLLVLLVDLLLGLEWVVRLQRPSPPPQLPPPPIDPRRLPPRNTRAFAARRQAAEAGAGLVLGRGGRLRSTTCPCVLDLPWR